MLDKKIIDLTERVTLYAPEGGNDYHASCEKVQVGLMQKDKFLANGYTETLPKKEGGKK